jgi:AcrR family transcriptional regulator
VVATSRGKRGERASSGPVSLEQISREAIRLFSERTYPSVGMRDISDAVGLLPGSLYAHIGSKEDLLMRIVERGITHYLDALGPVVESGGSATQRLRDVIGAYLRTLDATLEQTRVAVFQWRYLGEENKARAAKMRESFEQIFTRIVADGIESGEFRAARHPRLVTFGIIGLLNSVMHWYTPGDGLPADEIAEELADMVLGGLRAVS